MAGSSSGFNRTKSSDNPSNNGSKEQWSNPDYDDDSASDPNDSEDDDLPNIELCSWPNGSTKRIKDIKPGESVLGPDRMPRLVVDVSIGLSTLSQVRELTSNIEHWNDRTLGVVTFTCTPRQVLHLATPQIQGTHVGYNRQMKAYRVGYRTRKHIQGTVIVCTTDKHFRVADPSAREQAEGFADSRSKDVIYWNLSLDRQVLVSSQILQCTYQLTAALDFDAGRLKYHAIASGFQDDLGMPEKLAYLFGTWMGDGWSTRADIAVNRKDKAQIGRLEEICNDLGLTAKLREMTEQQRQDGYNGGMVAITGRHANHRNFFMKFLRGLGLGTPGSNCRSERIDGSSIWQQATIIKLRPCSALSNILSLCIVDPKRQAAPGVFTRHHCEYRYSAFVDDVVRAIDQLPDLPPEPPRNPNDETRALIRQLGRSTLTLLVKRYQKFGLRGDQISERLGVPGGDVSAYLSNKREVKKMDTFFSNEILEKVPIQWIRPLVLLVRNPPRHHAVALSLDPETDGLFVLGNNAVVASREQ
ncbi:H(+)-transporting V1 sector ATPase subunit A, partial [Mortierella alpina]